MRGKNEWIESVKKEENCLVNNEKKKEIRFFLFYKLEKVIKALDHKCMLYFDLPKGESKKQKVWVIWW